MDKEREGGEKIEAGLLEKGREERKGEAKKNVIEFNIEKISREFSKKEYI
jgi:hypothetical protein